MGVPIKYYATRLILILELSMQWLYIPLKLAWRTAVSTTLAPLFNSMAIRQAAEISTVTHEPQLGLGQTQME